MQTARKPTKEKSQRYTYEDYCTWDDDERWELIDGIAYAMSAPSLYHQSISGNIFGQLWQFLREKKSCRVFAAPFDVRFNFNKKNNTVVQPDIVVICDKSKRDERGGIGAADMVVEILSPSSATHDAIRKYRLYLKSGVHEYWIVDPEEKTVITHILADDTYRGSVYEQNDIVPVSVLEGCNVDFGEVFEE